MGLKDELALRNDPEEEEEAEEEEEEELVDVQETLKDSCRDDSHCLKYREELDSCNDRVNSKSETTESCAQELYDFIHCVDHCVSKSLFSKLK